MLILLRLCESHGQGPERLLLQGLGFTAAENPKTPNPKTLKP